MNKGQSINLKISYIAPDSGYTYCKLTFENDLCETIYLASGGWKGIKAKKRTLKLIQPNGGESFIVGSDTVITWDGVLPNDYVNIDYSIDNGNTWIVIADSIRGLSYKWRVPKTPSNLCLARVTTSIAEKLILFGY